MSIQFWSDSAASSVSSIEARAIIVSNAITAAEEAAEGDSDAMADATAAFFSSQATAAQALIEGTLTTEFNQAYALVETHWASITTAFETALMFGTTAQTAADEA